MQQKQVSKKDRILEAAFYLFIKNGFSNTKIIDIADAAGVGKGTVYEYFPSKEFLFAEVFRSRIIEAYRSVESILAVPGTAAEKLESLARFESEILASFGDDLHILPDMMMHSKEAIKDSIHQEIMDLWNMRYKSIRTIMSQGVADGEFRSADPDMMALAFMGSMNLYQILKHKMMPPCCPGVAGASAWLLEDYLELMLKGLKY